MAIQLDHLVVPARDQLAAAQLLAHLLGVPWSPTSVGPFAAVFVNDGLTLDFDQWPEPLPLIHYCFRVRQDEFDAILARIRAAGIAHRSAVTARWITRSIPRTAAASSTGMNPTDINGKC